MNSEEDQEHNDHALDLSIRDFGIYARAMTTKLAMDAPNALKK